MAISGVGLTLVTGGGLLLWSGLAGVTPLELVKSLAQGKQAPPVHVGSPGQVIRDILVAPIAQLSSGVGQSFGSVLGNTLRQLLPAAGGWLSTISDNSGAGAPNLSSASPMGARIAAAAASHLGVPYRWGGASPDGWDCSGMVTWVLHHDVGLELPDNSHTVSQSFLTWSGATTVPTDQMQPGDLVCWITHIAIVTGPGRAIGAENPRVGTIEGPIGQLGPGGGETYVIRRVNPQNVPQVV